MSRFEGFKSSGRLEDIRDKRLLNDILDYYQQAIPVLRESENARQRLNIMLADFVIENQVNGENGLNNNYEMMCRPKAQNLSKMLIPWRQLFHRYDAIIAKARGILKEVKDEGI